MKKLFPIFVIISLAVLAGCSSDKDIYVDDEYNGFDLYGVGRWDNAEDFVMRKYYTKVDTITMKSPDLSVIVKATEDTETEVDWYFDGEQFESIIIRESSNSADGIFITTYYPLLPGHFEYADGMLVEAVVQVGKNTVEREARLAEESMERDVLCVDFGMDSLTVKQEVEILRGEGKFFMREDGIGYENISPHFISVPPGKTLYIFDDSDTLVEVAEFPFMVLDTESEDGRFVLNKQFLEFCERLGMGKEMIEDIRFTEDGELVGTYSWTPEDITFTIFSRDDVFPAEPDSDGDILEEQPEKFQPNSIGISYRPAF
ncbi:MAG: hypothetical protein LUF87_10935 [Alistipes sp.]|nr:hypothetical protein [Alistipes sp.]